MDARERADRARRLLDDPMVQEALAEMEKRALDEFVNSSRWWWGDRRLRIAAEHIREVREFRHRLNMALRTGPAERIRSIA